MHERLGRYAEVADHHLRALALAAETGEGYQQARAHWKQAPALCTESGVPEAEAVRVALSTEGKPKQGGSS